MSLHGNDSHGISDGKKGANKKTKMTGDVLSCYGRLSVSPNLSYVFSLSYRVLSPIGTLVMVSSTFMVGSTHITGKYYFGLPGHLSPKQAL